MNRNRFTGSSSGGSPKQNLNRISHVHRDHSRAHMCVGQNEEIRIPFDLRLQCLNLKETFSIPGMAACARMRRSNGASEYVIRYFSGAHRKD